eukprot:TRINITY_DN2382_c0_g2_i1.p1 TRINITY_DN2382_c0_g2~~TRINITY_DN2382_c0_g2_i1.p1  ORF type:complete len:435 (+),score=141.76 TRINITY_DN2382_c0_g2_i1:223-1527(+)
MFNDKTARRQPGAKAVVGNSKRNVIALLLVALFCVVLYIRWNSNCMSKTNVDVEAKQKEIDELIARLKKQVQGGNTGDQNKVQEWADGVVKHLGGRNDDGGGGGDGNGDGDGGGGDGDGHGGDGDGGGHVDGKVRFGDDELPHDDLQELLKPVEGDGANDHDGDDDNNDDEHAARSPSALVPREFIFPQSKKSVGLPAKDANTYRRSAGARFLVSYPRTGSHWFRSLLELYFERPQLTRTFYYHDKTDYLLLHTHDERLRERGIKDLFYLYRDPVETVYSQCKFYKKDVFSNNDVAEVAASYGKNLHKWIHTETMSTHKTLIYYGRLEEDPLSEWGRVLKHLSDDPTINPVLDEDRLRACIAHVTKAEVKSKTGHDPRVVSRQKDYDAERERFRTEMGQFVWESLVADGRGVLLTDFPAEIIPMEVLQKVVGDN